MEKRALNDKGEALYDAKGKPLPVWEERRKLLFEYEADLVRVYAHLISLNNFGRLLDRRSATQAPDAKAMGGAKN